MNNIDFNNLFPITKPTENISFDDNTLYENLGIRVIFNIINQTRTSYGRHYLYNLLKHHKTDFSILEKQQKIILAIHEHVGKTASIKQILTHITKYEDILFKWLDIDYDCYSIKAPYSFMENTICLDIYNKAKYMFTLIMFLIYLFIYIYYRYCVDYYVSFQDYLYKIYETYYATCEYCVSFIINPDNSIFLYTAYFLSFVYTAYQIKNYYDLTNMCHGMYTLCESFKDDFCSIGKFVKMTKRLIKFDSITKTSSEKNNLRKLCTTLEEIFSIDGKMLGSCAMIYSNIKNYKNQFDLLFDYIGSLDAYISISKLLDDGFCLPYYISSNTPVLYASYLWNPLLGQKSVKNDFISIDSPLTIITGPNKAGKSTYMKTILLAVYLSQTIGISCCSEIILTPFKYIYEYMNVPDSIGRESLFEAELNKVHDYYTKISNLKKNEFSIGIIDELFTGTNPKEGEATSYAICKYLSTNTNTLNIVSTHFSGICSTCFDNTNYIKFTAEQNELKNLQYKFNYKAEYGISTQHIAINLLKQKGFEESILNNANDKILSL